jgi:hypothetical protein
LTGIGQAWTIGLVLRLAGRFIVPGMLVHCVVLAGESAVMRILRDSGQVVCLSAGPTEQHGRSGEPLERNSYQEQASHEHAKSGHSGDSSD